MNSDKVQQLCCGGLLNLHQINPTFLKAAVQENELTLNVEAWDPYCFSSQKRITREGTTTLQDPIQSVRTHQLNPVQF